MGLHQTDMAPWPSNGSFWALQTLRMEKARKKGGEIPEAVLGAFVPDRAEAGEAVRAAHWVAWAWAGLSLSLSLQPAGETFCELTWPVSSITSVTDRLWPRLETLARRKDQGGCPQWVYTPPLPPAPP